MSGGHGGYRPRAGRKPDPLSARSLERRGALVELPVEGYDGPVPDFPLPDATAREHDVWQEAWRSPQACVWADEPWRHRTAALWTRWSVRSEDLDATAASAALAGRLADQLGLTPSGLVEQGWSIGPRPDRTGRRVTTAERNRRTGLSPRDRFRGTVPALDQDAPVSSLERARQRSERLARDPRQALYGDDRTPDDAG